MRSIKLAIGLAAVAGALFSGTAQADDPITVCESSQPNVYKGCTHVHTDDPCVDGGGRIANRSAYMFFPCH